jgi:hypothetical protein
MAEQAPTPFEETSRRVLKGFSKDMIAQSGNQLVIKNKPLADLIESKFSDLAKHSPGETHAISIDVTVRIGT